jgi:DNA-binding CsgD family transcriptional regulator
MQETDLTQRKADVARLVCGNLSDKEIVGNLNLSSHTIYDHWKKFISSFECVPEPEPN